MKISINKLTTNILLAALLVTSVAQPMKRQTTIQLKRQNTPRQGLGALGNQLHQNVVESPTEEVDLPVILLNNELYHPGHAEYSIDLDSLWIPVDQIDHSLAIASNQSDSSPQYEEFSSDLALNECGFYDQDQEILTLYQNSDNSTLDTQQKSCADTDGAGNDNGIIKLYGCDVGSELAIDISLDAASHSGTIQFMLDVDEYDFYNLPIPFNHITHAMVNHIVNCLNIIQDTYSPIVAMYHLASYIITELMPEELDELSDASNFFDIELLNAVIEGIKNRPQAEEIQQQPFDSQKARSEETREESREEPIVIQSVPKNKATKNGKASFECEICGQTFAKKETLTRHQQVHSGKKPFTCETCDRAFARNDALTRHQLVHTGEKPFKCKTCREAFARESDRTKHQLVHTGEKPFECKNCGKAFAQKGNLNEHIKTHTGEKPHQCETCGQRFTHKGALNKHQDVHSGDKPFECQYCDSGFIKEGSLTYHIKKLHPEKVIKKNKSKKPKR